MTEANACIIETVQRHYPETQAVYLFGSHGTDEEWPDSDVDIALLLPPLRSKKIGSLALIELRLELEALLHKPVDLINLRQVSTVLQKEIIGANRRIYTANRHAADEFEMLTLSFYRKLNEERKEILEQFWATGRAYHI